MSSKINLIIDLVTFLGTVPVVLIYARGLWTSSIYIVQNYLKVLYFSPSLTLRNWTFSFVVSIEINKQILDIVIIYILVDKAQINTIQILIQLKSRFYFE